jgi:predicted DNA-binding transcriptional regulator AlpA
MKDEHDDSKNDAEAEQPIAKEVADELLDVYATCRFLGGSRPINPATLWRGVKKKRYSAPIKIGPQSVRWRKRELQADIERFIAERDRELEGAA